MLVKSHQVGPWQTNCYLVATKPGSDCVIIDPGFAARAEITAALEATSLRPQAIIATHGHVDHVADAAALSHDWEIPVYIHPADEVQLTQPLTGLDPQLAPIAERLLGTSTLSQPWQVVPLLPGPLELAGIEFDCRHVPGHTPGSMVLGAGDQWFTGDFVFAGTIGRMDLPGGSQQAMIQSLNSVVDLSGAVYPGHGPSTTWAAEQGRWRYLWGPEMAKLS